MEEKQVLVWRVVAKHPRKIDKFKTQSNPQVKDKTLKQLIGINSQLCIIESVET